MIRSADISPCGRYRYDLRIRWDTSKDSLTFIMCNPSTADAVSDDPTIRTCIKHANRLGFGGIIVVNLFAYRTVDPKILMGIASANEIHNEAIGPKNEAAIAAAIPDSGFIIAAWGAIAEGIPGYKRMFISVEEFALGRADIMSFGTTASGAPKHPLARGKSRIANDATPAPWPANRPPHSPHLIALARAFGWQIRDVE